MTVADAAAPRRHFSPAAPHPTARTRTGHLRSVPTAAPAASAPPAAAATEARVSAADRIRARRAAAQRAAGSVTTARPVTWLRTAGRVMVRDASGSWIVQDRTLSIGDVWHADYAVPGDYRPFRLYCKGYTRTIGVAVAAALDGAKWVFYHPVRGPLAALSITAGTYAVPAMF